MDLFVDALERRAGESVAVAVEEAGGGLLPGSAFINSVNEIGADLHEVYGVATRHTADEVSGAITGKRVGPAPQRNTRRSHPLQTRISRRNTVLAAVVLLRERVAR